MRLSLYQRLFHAMIDHNFRNEPLVMTYCHMMTYDIEFSHVVAALVSFIPDFAPLTPQYKVGTASDGCLKCGNETNAYCSCFAALVFQL